MATTRASYFEVHTPGAASELPDEIKVRNARMQEMQESMTRVKLPRALVVLLVIALITVSSAGLILGFGPVYSLLLGENQWRELCSPEEDAANVGMSCPPQEVYLQYVYSTSFLFLSLGMAFFGIFLDFAGPRLNSMIGMAISILGLLLFAFGDSHTDKGYAIIAGYSLIAVGGYAIYTSSFQFAQLFERQGLMCSFISGFFNASGYMFMLLMLNGISREAFFSIYAGVALVCMGMAYVIYPLHTIKKPATHYTPSGLRWRTPIFVKPRGLWLGLRAQLVRPDLWYFGMFFGWISMIFAFAGGALPSIIRRLGADVPATADDYVNYYTPVIFNSSFIYTPFVAYAIDKWGFRPAILFTVFVVHLLLGSLMIHSLHFQIVSLFLYGIAQAAFYSLQFAYIVKCFPTEVYGSLQAFLAVWSFSVSLLNYAFTPWVQNHLDGNYTPVFCIMAGPLVLFYFFIRVVKTGLDQDESKLGGEEAARI